MLVFLVEAKQEVQPMRVDFLLQPALIEALGYGFHGKPVQHLNRDNSTFVFGATTR